MIMVVIAGLWNGVILGWMSGISAPRSIDAVYSQPFRDCARDGDHDGIYTGTGISMTITVLDQNGEPVSGATVVP
jgi:protocatechuate 3,4-dioxygenase beta subunit